MELFSLSPSERVSKQSFQTIPMRTVYDRTCVYVVVVVVVLNSSHSGEGTCANGWNIITNNYDRRGFLIRSGKNVKKNKFQRSFVFYNDGRVDEWVRGATRALRPFSASFDRHAPCVRTRFRNTAEYSHGTKRTVADTRSYYCLLYHYYYVSRVNVYYFRVKIIHTLHALFAVKVSSFFAIGSCRFYVPPQRRASETRFFTLTIRPRPVLFARSNRLERTSCPSSSHRGRVFDPTIIEKKKLYFHTATSQSADFRFAKYHNELPTLTEFSRNRYNFVGAIEIRLS